MFHDDAVDQFIYALHSIRCASSGRIYSRKSHQPRWLVIFHALRQGWPGLLFYIDVGYQAYGNYDFRDFI